MIKPPKDSAIDKSAIFRNTLTYPCPRCGKYHNSLPAAMKCVAIVSNLLDSMTSYYANLGRRLKGEKTNSD